VGSGAVRFAIFGLTISSAWANGHATPWRGLLKALHAAGHHATFFERDVAYYAAHRVLHASLKVNRYDTIWMVGRKP